MPIALPPRCWRGRDDCDPLHSVESFGPGEANFDEVDFDAIANGERNPISFVCCGCVAEKARTDCPQDAYRVCWKNELVDEIGDYDEQDLTHTLMVISQALGVLATRRVNSGIIEVPTEQSKQTP